MNVSILDSIKSKYLLIEVSVARTSMKVLEKSTGIKSLWDCLEICESKYQCHFVGYFFDEQECWLYHKTANLQLFGSKDWARREIYERLIYRRVEIQGMMILDESYMYTYANDSESCWKECLNEENCSLITYQYSTNDCYFFEDQNTIRYIEDYSDFTAVSYLNILGDKNRKKAEIEYYSDDYTTTF